MYIVSCVLWALTPAFVTVCLITTDNLLEGIIHVLTFSWTFQLGIIQAIQARCVRHIFVCCRCVEIDSLVSFRHCCLSIVGDQIVNWYTFDHYDQYSILRLLKIRLFENQRFFESIWKPRSSRNRINKRSDELHKRAKIWIVTFFEIKIHVVKCEVAAGQKNKFRFAIQPSTPIITQARDNSQTFQNISKIIVSSQKQSPTNIFTWKFISKLIING